MVNEWKPLIIFAKSSTLHVLLVNVFFYHFLTIFPKPGFINPTLIKLLQKDSNPKQEILGVNSL